MNQNMSRPDSPKNGGGLMTWIIVIILIAVVGFFAFSDKSDKEEESMNESNSMEQAEVMSNDTSMNQENEMMDEGMEEAGPGMMQSAGTYEVYSAEKIAMADTKDVVLFFRADWCPTCRALDKDIKESLSDIPEGLVILDVNYDNEKELKQKYGVTYQHTFVQVDAEGNMIAKWSGSPTLEALVKEVK